MQVLSCASDFLAASVQPLNQVGALCAALPGRLKTVEKKRRELRCGWGKRAGVFEYCEK
jgi:hypothetical protein